MAKKKWNDKLVFKAYELALSGMRDIQIAKALGVRKGRFSEWKRLHPLLAYGVARARKKVTSSSNQLQTFSDYVYAKLDKPIKKLWDEITELDEADSGQEAIEALLAKNGLRARQNIFIHAMVMSNFSVNVALQKANISRATLEHWKRDEPSFALLLDELNWYKKNWFEDQLSRLVAGGDTYATIFANKTQNRDRGYGDHRTLETRIQGQIEQTTTHQICLDELDLPPELTKTILEHIRKRKTVTSRTLPEKVTKSA